MKIGAGGLQIQAVHEVIVKKQAENSADFGKKQSAEAKGMEQIGSGIKAAPSDVMKAVEKLNEYTQLSNSYLQFQIHDETKKLMVKVIDANGEVIREIPPEKTLEMLARLEESCGAIIDCYI